ncbi:hypothetical protein AV274_2013 [Blastocystis sp. ATCC 50177/Nand II]|nr:hypothetical protein AV274_2013 [Blastocystis sp. ATCC 50177/Nand II]
MNSDSTPVETAEEGKLALIVPQYTYDAKTFQLLRRKNNEEFDKIINRVSFRKDGYSITDADSDEFYAPQDAIDDEEWASRLHFVGNAKTLTELYTALYENRAFSQIIYSVGNSIMLGEKMRDEVLNPKEQKWLLNSSHSVSMKPIENSNSNLLENAEASDLTLTKSAPRVKRSFQSLNIHTESPIIINEHGEYPTSAAREAEPKESCWNHTVIWSTRRHYCIVETDYPVIRQPNQPATAIHMHEDKTPITEEEALRMYLNNRISSADQVAIFNIADNKPKYISVVKTEDIPFLTQPAGVEEKRSFSVCSLQRNIESLMEFLLEGCAGDGAYWLYKEEGDVSVRLMELSSVFGMEEVGATMSEAEKRRKEVTWK